MKRLFFIFSFVLITIIGFSQGIVPGVTTTINMRSLLLDRNRTYQTTDKGHEGTWYYDATDLSSSDNVGTVIVDIVGRRWKRVPNGSALYPAEWFYNGTYDSSKDIGAALRTMGNVLTAQSSKGTILFGAYGNRYYKADSAFLRTGVSWLGYGCVIRANDNPTGRGLFLMGDAVVQKTTFKGLDILGNVNNPNQDGFHIEAYTTGSGFTTGGLWYTQFEDINVLGFSKAQMYFKCRDTTYDMANQWLTFTNVRCFANTGASSRATYVEGQFGQIQYLNCEFDGSSTITSGSSNYEYVQGTAPSDFMYSMVCTNCTFQQSDSAVKLGTCLAVKFDGCHWERTAMALVLAAKAQVTVTSSGFNNGAESDLVAGRAAGAGAIVYIPNSYINFRDNGIIGTYDVVVDGANAYQGCIFSGNTFGTGTGTFTSRNMTYQVAISSGSIACQLQHLVYVNASATTLTNFDSQLGEGELLTIRAVNTSSGTPSVIFGNSGNIAFSGNNIGNVFSIGANELATFIKRGTSFLLVAASTGNRNSSANQTISGTPTTVTVTHGFSSISSTSRVLFTPTSVSSSTAGWYISAVTSTTFTVTYPTTLTNGASWTANYQIIP